MEYTNYLKFHTVKLYGIIFYKNIYMILERKCALCQLFYSDLLHILSLYLELYGNCCKVNPREHYKGLSTLIVSIKQLDIWENTFT